MWSSHCGVPGHYLVALLTLLPRKTVLFLLDGNQHVIVVEWETYWFYVEKKTNHIWRAKNFVFFVEGKHIIATVEAKTLLLMICVEVKNIIIYGLC